MPVPLWWDACEMRARHNTGIDSIGVHACLTLLLWVVHRRMHSNSRGGPSLWGNNHHFP